MKTKLSDDAISQHLTTLTSWQRQGDRIRRLYTFKDFLAAIDFIQRLATHAEELDHHPELFNVYNRITIELTTHDASGLTSLDFILAARLDALYDEMTT